jgi:hypothetical protein
VQLGVAAADVEAVEIGRERVGDRRELDELGAGLL